MRSLALLVGFLMAAVTLRAEPTSIELILDCSGSMWNKLADGRYRIDAAKQVLSEFIATAPEREDLHLGLRLYGSRVPHREPGACEDTVLVVPIEGFKRREMLKLVRDAKALGATPLALSLNAAADDFSKPGKKQVVVFTDGEESCNGDLRAALAKLQADGINADVRIIGIGLPKAAADRFASLVPIENTDSVAKLAAALKNATSATMTAPAAAKVAPKAQKVWVKVTKAGGPLKEGSVTMTGVDQKAVKLATTKEAGTWEGELAPGLYTAVIAPAGRSFANLSIARGEAETVFTFDVTELPKVLVEVLKQDLVLNQEFKVRYAKAADVESQYVVIAPEGAPDSADPLWAAAPGKEGEVTFRAPSIAGRYEARFSQFGAEHYEICGRSTVFEVKVPEVMIQVPDKVAALSPIPVKYKAMVQEDHWIGWVKAGAPDGEYQDWKRLSAESDTLEITAPAEPGDYEMRYSCDGNTVPFARQKFQVEAASFKLEAPAEAMAGTAVQITWAAPINDSIYVTIAAKGSAANVSTDYKYLKDQPNPLTLNAPRTAGDMEVRIIQEREGKIALARPLKLTEMKATIKGPTESKTVAEIKVQWTGPAGDGDMVAISKKGSADAEYVSYTYTYGAAAELNLYTQEERGEFELRYIAGDGKVLARQALSVK